jgi:hypothetical protein
LTKIGTINKLKIDDIAVIPCHLLYLSTGSNGQFRAHTPDFTSAVFCTLISSPDDISDAVVHIAV